MSALRFSSGADRGSEPRAPPDSASIGTQHAPTDIESSVPVTLSASAESAHRWIDDDRKKTIIGAIKLILETAVANLKFSSIANLDQIPSMILRWIQIYENISSNAEDLNWLYEVIQKTHDSVLEPLRKWTEEVPPEIRSLVQEICVALQEQVEGIELVQKEKGQTKRLQASDMTQQITNMKNCLNDATHRYEVGILESFLWSDSDSP
ncbi:uncharacterized protein EI90DRAFT_1759107 [Cantharellus anzutake]|uniref:uncharacterized protein n=1 Tax=Cantharellus anzutake TaxID=1750568 RepID=UPI001904E356|nr:uncharacterized protein EI90DRAFT_1759107 [Cantharellus anzutake]KAF8341611.1 hypothetical protein EI90DRAFT_1759107 [Cantharellus anzutake]